ncbi:MAG: hypothetical protein LDL31_12580 [Prosthecobacter sp.]|jgi:uncharacterized protein YbaR (Trm112 family)|nr:hypothetical protein [Prosthecobacter sp.]
MSTDWLQHFLPLMRCPDTHQPLRVATPEDLQRHGLPAGTNALCRQDGSRIFLIDDGIPILLPEGSF